MKSSLKFTALLSAAAMLAFIQPLQAQRTSGADQSSPSYKQNSSKSSSTTQDASGSSSSKSVTGAAGVGDHNASVSAGVSTDNNATASAHQIQKASDLIGKEVKNQQDEKLGKIKDLAIDLQSGKISYAVLGTGGTLFGTGEKFIAVPTTLLTQAGEKDFVVLNASKQQLESMQGFDKNNWPSMPASAWGAGRLDSQSTTSPSSSSDIDSQGIHKDKNHRGGRHDKNGASPESNPSSGTSSPGTSSPSPKK